MQRGSRVRITGFIFDCHGEKAIITKIVSTGADRTARIQLESGLKLVIATKDLKEIETDFCIGSACLCNTASLNVYALTDDTIKAGINDDKARTYKLHTTNKGIYFNFGARYYLHEFMSV